MATIFATRSSTCEPLVTLADGTACGRGIAVTYTGPTRELRGLRFTAYRCSCAGYTHAARISYELRDAGGTRVALCVDPESLTPTD